MSETYKKTCDKRLTPYDKCAKKRAENCKASFFKSLQLSVHFSHINLILFTFHYNNYKMIFQVKLCKVDYIQIFENISRDVDRMHKFCCRMDGMCRWMWENMVYGITEWMISKFRASKLCRHIEVMWIGIKFRIKRSLKMQWYLWSELIKNNMRVDIRHITWLIKRNKININNLENSLKKKIIEIILCSLYNKL